MDRIQYVSQFHLMRSLSETDLTEMDKLTIITTVRIASLPSLSMLQLYLS
ncbi:hypothetical protein [Paenibacillus sp. 1011MAR3C5]|nr:hypothetical protein [Paenibacillus sp. 1011MAR3C5]